MGRLALLLSEWVKVAGGCEQVTVPGGILHDPRQGTTPFQACRLVPGNAVSSVGFCGDRRRGRGLVGILWGRAQADFSYPAGLPRGATMPDEIAARHGCRPGPHLGGQEEGAHAGKRAGRNRRRKTAGHPPLRGADPKPAVPAAREPTPAGSAAAARNRERRPG